MGNENEPIETALQSDYSKIESGKRYFTFEQRRKLASAQDTSMDDLAEITDEKELYPRNKQSNTQNIGGHMNKQLKALIYRDWDFKGWKNRRKRELLYPEIRICVLYRKAAFYTKSKNPLMKLFWSWRWLRLRRSTKCQISLKASIGEGLRLLHDGPRIVSSKAIIGTDCTMGINVIVGYGIDDHGVCSVPKIGNSVYIGHNSTIVGNIEIGDYVLIAPNTYVNKSVPSHSIVLGNNIIIPKNDPSSRYLKLC